MSCGDVEGRAIQWHGVDISLPRVAAPLLCRPHAAVIISRPPVADLRAVLRGDAKVCKLRVFRIYPTCSIMEFYIIYIPLIKYVHDGRAVALNGFLGNGLRREAGLFPDVAAGDFLPFSRGQRHRGRLAARQPGFRDALHEGIRIVVRVLNPIDDGVAYLLRLPDRLQAQRAVQHPAPCILGIALRPIAEGIARTGRRLGRGRIFVRQNEDGRLVSTAIAVKLNPMAGFDLRIQQHIFIRQHNGGNRLGKAGVQIPACDARLRVDSEGSVGHNCFAGRALARLDHAPVRIEEENIIDLREGRLIYLHFVLRQAGDYLIDRRRGRSVLGVDPAGEPMSLLRGRGRGNQRFAVSHILLCNGVTRFILENGMKRKIVGADGAQGKRLRILMLAADRHFVRQRRRGQAGDDHEHRQHDGGILPKPGFHDSSSFLDNASVSRGDSAGRGLHPPIIVPPLPPLY